MSTASMHQGMDDDDDERDDGRDEHTPLPGIGPLMPPAPVVPPTWGIVGNAARLRQALRDAAAARLGPVPIPPEEYEMPPQHPPVLVPFSHEDLVAICGERLAERVEAIQAAWAERRGGLDWSSAPVWRRLLFLRWLREQGAFGEDMQSSDDLDHEDAGQPAS